MSAYDKQTVLAEIVAMTTLPDKLPSDITARDYANEAGCTAKTATQRLNDLVEEGVLVTCECVDPATNHKVRVWRKPD